MSNQLVTSENNERIKSFFLSLDNLSLAVERLFAGKRPALNGEHFYTDGELSKKCSYSGVYLSIEIKPEKLKSHPVRF